MRALAVPDALTLDIEGEGPPVLLLHGFTGSARTWARQITALRSRHRTIAPDLLGHGRSPAPADPSRYALARQASGLAALLDAVGAPRADVVGYSMGARIALRLALDHPDRVSRLVLESPSPGFDDPALRAARRATDERTAEELEADGIEAFVSSWERRPLFASHDALDGDVRAAIRAERLAQRPVGLANALRGGGQGAMEPLHDGLAAIGSPTLIVAGALDPVGTARARRIAGAMPRAQLEIIGDAGHAPHLERPRAFTGLLTTFLDDDRPGQQGGDR